MKKNLTLAVIAIMFVGGLYAQSTSDQPKLVVENMYLLPKRGMDDKFEAAVKAHDLKYHPDGPYKAGLRKVEYGSKAGWYVWVYGPTTYSSIDTRPAKEAGHDDDWSKNVDPLVETYGETSLYELNSDLSYGRDILYKSKYYEMWQVDLKRGEYYRFKALAEKLKKTYESMGTTAFIIFDNQLHSTNGPDLAIIWSFNTYADWSNDPGPKAAYEKLYGAGSWQHMLDEWMDIIVDYNSEIRSFVK
jgi:hypothetical protein